MKKKLLVLILALSILFGVGITAHADPKDPIPKSLPKYPMVVMVEEV